jgi:hypothetical protein
MSDAAAFRCFLFTIGIVMITAVLGAAWIIRMNLIHNWGCP